MDRLDAIKARAEATTPRADLAFITHAREDVDRLVAAIEAALEQCDDVAEFTTRDEVFKHWFYNDEANCHYLLALFDVRTAIHRALEEGKQ